ncbi:beta-1,4-glucuronyltransferase 1-like [Centruroides sculpturatus]|uniref:beta-1,4-glucuronyltransferase 1-like n=1 Tax=Centruroides sculpturatus TaxID=218467 RepID=UPI000C6CA3B1|nr:beta-1,4-glucuronyltransferase 1-like [Centruroides sculpturatus]
MTCRWCRTANRSSTLLVYTVIAVLTTFNLLGLFVIQRHRQTESEIPTRLDKRRPLADKLTKKPEPTRTMQLRDVINYTTLVMDKKYKKVDKSGNYIQQDFVVMGDEWPITARTSKICLATQCSVDRLFMLLEVGEAWSAPMSVALFVPGPDFQIATLYISYLRLCSDTLRVNASFHLLYPKESPPKEVPKMLELVLLSCSRSRELLIKLLNSRDTSFQSWRNKVLYPQNHLRNLARNGCETNYHYLTDVDIVPVPGLSEDLDEFLRNLNKTTCAKCAFVVPTYEMRETSRMPTNKNELLSMVRRKECRPFHYKVFIYNQFATNHSLWESLPETATLTAAYKVNNYEFFYEPFYVADNEVPPNDERFVGYGFTRNTQVFEMHVAGYEFWVLNPVFAVHRGIQNRRSRGAWRDKQNFVNRKKFVQFKADLLRKYGQTAKPRLQKGQHVQ